jgi:peptidoglycan hydrolase CwlO-like protein
MMRLENLRAVVEKDAVTINDLKAENKQLKVEGAKKGNLIERLLKEAKDNHNLMNEAIGEIIEKSNRIYLEYKKALATFGAEPARLPQDLEGLATSLLNWILNEFTLLADILSITSDNSTVILSESVLAILDREGC